MNGLRPIRFFLLVTAVALLTHCQHKPNSGTTRPPGAPAPSGSSLEPHASGDQAAGTSTVPSPSVSPSESSLPRKQLGQTRQDLGARLRHLYGSDAATGTTFGLNTMAVGESATGVVVEESHDELYLDSRPCEGQIMQFHKPFRKENTGEFVTCDSKRLPTVRVIQQAGTAD